jgi:proteasome lid subunit RPN8/RPN11
VQIARELIDEVVTHAREDAPNECCGMIAADNGRAVRVYPAEKRPARPDRGAPPRAYHHTVESRFSISSTGVV